MNIKGTQKSPGKSTATVGTVLNYNEVVEFLNAHWSTNIQDKDFKVLKKIDKELGNPSEKVAVVAVAGSNGKSITINLAAQLLKEEGLKVGCLYSPHILTYNERIALNNESVPNKVFTEIGNDVIRIIKTAGLTAHSQEVLLAMALHHFAKSDVDVVLVEVPEGFEVNPISFCNPKITAITRVISDAPLKDGDIPQKLLDEIFSVVKPGSYVVSADQSKLYLQTMLERSAECKANWSMPIRKLAQLSYPFEQIHGRCAALAERIADIFVNTLAYKDAIVVGKSLIAKEKGQRGRPTLEAKRQAELNPKRTVEQFWRETENGLSGRFQLLDREKPSILLDNAHNMDAFKNLLLGVRLLHYQRPLKGLTVVVGCNNPELDVTEFLKLFRYFFKKTPGELIICPVESAVYSKEYSDWDIAKINSEIAAMKIKACVAENFEQAIIEAQSSVDERHGLVVVTGSSEILREYWKFKGIKKV